MEPPTGRRREIIRVTDRYQMTHSKEPMNGRVHRSLPFQRWKNKITPMPICGGESFVQYIKMTKDLDLSKMTNSKEILPQYRDQLGTEIKDIFLWAIGQNAITEMTKAVREREPSSLPLYKLYTLFRLHFTPERSAQQSRADFFDLKREDGETAADVWKRILEVEKNCEFDTIIAAELLASKFLSVIEKSTGDYELKKKIRKSDMSLEAITAALHEYMYEKVNDSPETEEEKKIRYLNERKTKNIKDLSEKPAKFKKVDCNR